MDGDHVISPEEACELQSEAQQIGNLMMWTITHGTADYGDRWAARPQTVRERPIPFPFVLLADQLEELRAKLPPGLTCLTRHSDDDPVIVEVWL